MIHAPDLDKLWEKCAPDGSTFTYDDEGYCIKHARRVCGHKAPVQLRGRPVPLDTLIGGES